MNFINILSGLLVPTIAIVTVYIAYEQYQINKRRLSNEEYKLRFDLYNKRYRIFWETKKVLHKIVQDASINIIELRDFGFSTNESKFLFDNDIIQFLEGLKSNAIKISNGNADLNDWFSDEYETIEHRFNKYLNLKNL